MTREEKQLLLKDLCARLPYGVKATIVGIHSFIVDGVTVEHDGITIWLEGGSYSLEIVKPYLRSMSSMTEEESSELYVIRKSTQMTYSVEPKELDWLLSNHFDIRGLIEKGLALEAKEGMYA